MITRPMLAATVEDINSLRYPLLVTPKIDGIRCLLINGVALSRTFKPIPNRYVQEYLSSCYRDYVIHDVDGELIVGKNFQETSSGIMSEDGEPDFQYLIFDWFGHTEMEYWKRVAMLSHPCKPARIEFLLPAKVNTPKELADYTTTLVASGYEGAMLRNPDGPYKCGRSTLREGYLMKLKPFSDSEAFVIGFIEKMHNAGRLKEDNFGLAKRSHRKDDMMPEDTLGALIVRDEHTGVEFNIGTGFDDRMRKEIWSNQHKYLGQRLTYKYQKHGMKDKPRSPVFLRWRTNNE